MILIRPGTFEDAPAIARVHVDTWRTTYAGIVPDEHLAKLSYERSQSRWQEHLSEHPEQATFVAEEPPGRVVGFTSCGAIREPVGDVDGELYGIYILKEFQGRGIGRALVRQVALHLAEQGFHSMALWALKENPACGFYERMGGSLAAERTIEIGGKLLPEVAYAWQDLTALCR